jgi:hypothetical protein
MIISQLVSVLSLIVFKPFDDPALNRLETVNEFLVLIAYYHLIFFSQANSQFRLKYLAGWSLNLIVFLMFIGNASTFATQGIQRVFQRLRRFIKAKIQSTIRIKPQIDRKNGSLKKT